MELINLTAINEGHILYSEAVENLENVENIVAYFCVEFMTTPYPYYFCLLSNGRFTDNDENEFSS